MTGLDVLNLVRFQTKDYQDAVTSPFDKWTAINAANRFVRRMALELKPSILNATETGNLVAGTSEYTLTNIPNKITEVRVNGNKLAQADPQNIVNLTTTGTPLRYFVTAYNKITFHPVPDAVLPYSVRMVAASSGWDETTVIPWNSDIVDIVVAYAVGSLVGSLNAAELKQELRKILGSIEESTVGVSSYWAVTDNTKW